MIWLGIDTGGTFTDFVCFDGQGALRVHKVLSTPHAPEEAILRGVAELGLPLQQLRIVHGSTVATNAALEGQGVRTAFVTNRGFADMLSIGRQQRRALYDLTPMPQTPPVPRELCLETGGRLAADGRLIEPLTEADVTALGEQLKALAPEAVAVNLLFSYLDPSLEQRLRAAMPEECFVSLSSEVLPEMREYERGMATWLNAWIGPRVAGYLARLQQALPGVPLAVMQSSGETVQAGQAAEHAVRMLLSGPAGGLVGAQHVAAQSGLHQLLSFDMGGTSTDVALLDGVPRLTTEGHIGDYPVAVPMMDMHTIGAGGGSIAWIDAGGMLQLGPQSAGADPGPACYGRGGVEPTVTDANLLLGRLQADAFLGGEMQLDREAAERAMQSLADRLGGDALEAAAAIIAVANAHMARALRNISIRRGVDARGFTLVSFGGAGALHVCELAATLGMQRALVPVHGGVLSALGMLAAAPGRQLSRTLLCQLDAAAAPMIEQILAELRELGQAQLGEAQAEHLEYQPTLDLRYAGQSYTLNLAWESLDQVQAAFHKAHYERYGHRLDGPVELVTVRLAVHALGSGFALAPHIQAEAAPQLRRVPLGRGGEADLWRREALPPGWRVRGPAIIAEQVATTWLATGWIAEVDAVGNLLLQQELPKDCNA